MEKRIIMIGIGQTGVDICNDFHNRMQQFEEQYPITVIALDTDVTAFDDVSGPIAISMTESAPLASVVEKIGVDNVSEWFPCNWQKDGTQRLGVLEMNHGTGQIRAKGLLSFVHMLSRPELKQEFLSAIDSVLTNLTEKTVVELYVAASLAGGTGSALFCAVALYVEKYIREKYSIEANAKAFLVTPEVFADKNDQTFLERAHANAYAALQELHVINKVAYGAPDASAYAYRLGQSNDPNMGLLFDSQDETYHTDRFAPFRDVILFDHLPGLYSLYSYEKMWADILTLTALGTISYEESKETPLALYHGFSCVRYSFDADKVVEMMADRRVREVLNDELVPHIKKVDQSWKLFHLPQEKHNLTAFCDYVGYGEYLYDGKKDPQSEKDERDKNDATFMTKCRVIMEQALSEKYHCAVPEEILSSLSKIQTKLMSLKLLAPKKEKNRLISDLRQAYSLLTNYFYNCREIVKAIHLDTVDGIWNDTSSFQKLIKVISDEEQFQNKPMAIFNSICRVRNEWNITSDRFPSWWTMLYLPKSEKHEETIPGTIVREAIQWMEQKQHFYVPKAAADYEDGKFEFLTKNISAKKMPAYCEIIANFAEFLSQMTAGYLYDCVRKQFDSYIFKFMAFWDRTAVSSKVLADSAVALDKMNDSKNHAALSVGLTEKEFDTVYSEYYGEELQKTEEYEGLLHEILVLLSQDEVTPGSVRSIWKRWRKELADRTRTTEMYRKLQRKNVVETMMTSIAAEYGSFITNEKIAEILLKQLSVPTPPFRHDDIDTPDHHYCPMEKVSVFVSEYSSKLLPSSALDVGGMDNVAVTGDESIPDAELYVVNEIRSLYSEQVVAFDESRDLFGTYRDFLGSLDEVRQRETQLRNPYVNRLEMTRGRLPFLNDGAQREFDLQAVKALWYGLSAGGFILNWNEELQECYFSVRINGYFSDISVNGSAVTAREPSHLLQWLHAHPRVVQIWAAQFDSDIELYRLNLQGELFPFTERSVQRILEMPYFTVMTQGLMANLKGCDKKYECSLWRMVQDLSHSNVQLAQIFVTHWRTTCDGICRKMAGGGERTYHLIRDAVYTVVRDQWSKDKMDKNSANWVTELTRID